MSLQPGDRVRRPGNPAVYTVVGLISDQGRIALDAWPWVTEAVLLERVFVLDVGGVQVIRNSRGTFEIGEYGFETLEEAARFIVELCDRG